MQTPFTPASTKRSHEADYTLVGRTSQSKKSKSSYSSDPSSSETNVSSAVTLLDPPVTRQSPKGKTFLLTTKLGLGNYKKLESNNQLDRGITTRSGGKKCSKCHQIMDWMTTGSIKKDSGANWYNYSTFHSGGCIKVALNNKVIYSLRDGPFQ